MAPHASEPPSTTAGVTRRWVFLLWVVAFYAAYAAFLPVLGGWSAVAPHWPIGAVMVLGSYFAGSTPVGGGSVAFPILVIAFGQTAALGRSFSFAVQSLGMTSAALFLWSRRRTVDSRFLRWAIPGALIGTPLGCVLLAPIVPDASVKLLFASVWAAFGVLALARLGRTVSHRSERPEHPAAALALGLLGGATVGALLGSGVDMLAFCYLVLRRRVDLAVAIRSGMILMAATSLAGLATGLIMGVVPREVLGPWLAAAPIVVLGAPLGALMVGLIPRKITLVVVAVLCVAQFLWMLAQQRPEPAALVGAIGIVLLMLGAFRVLEGRGVPVAEDPERKGT